MWASSTSRSPRRSSGCADPRHPAASAHKKERRGGRRSCAFSYQSTVEVPIPYLVMSTMSGVIQP
ncbi:hypothetical protein CA236_00495 [Sphingomonas sp. ABOLG]|uniref:Uncharacterized protein n=1 Tax=Sphingomonas olei TaxID=1886787 RepID=A0ABY2QLB2_9SPHN|nr:hypothetical protein CA236_00495 [Sphingomonas sp. ABOLG]THG41758.1 hypothetical protein E5988_03770 [Sphingomonas olei]